MKFDYAVADHAGRRVMHTEYPSCRYDPKTEAQLLAAGYRITINGKRLTKKAAAIQQKSPP